MRSMFVSKTYINCIQIAWEWHLKRKHAPLMKEAFKIEVEHREDDNGCEKCEGKKFKKNYRMVYPHDLNPRRWKCLNRKRNGATCNNRWNVDKKNLRDVVLFDNNIKKYKKYIEDGTLPDGNHKNQEFIRKARDNW